MNRLEERYRRLLKVLPRSYRAQWEDDMVATYLLSMKQDDPEDDQFFAEHGNPSAAEMRSVLALAVRLRLGGSGASPGYLLFADAVRRFALLTLLLHAALRLVSSGALLWSYVDPPAGPPNVYLPSTSSIALELLGLLIVPAFLALVSGRRRMAAALAVLGFLPSFISAVTFVSDGGFAPSAVGQFLFELLSICALAAFHADAPAVPRRPWLALFAFAVVLQAAFVAMAHLTPVPAFLYGLDVSGVWCGYVLFAAIAYAMTARARNKSWPMAIAMLAGATLGLRLLTLLSYILGHQADNVLARVAVMEAVVIALTAVITTVLARRVLSSFRAASTSPAPPERRTPGSAR
jgi:hypothetical protein